MVPPPEPIGVPPLRQRAACIMLRPCIRRQRALPVIVILDADRSGIDNDAQDENRNEKRQFTDLLRQWEDHPSPP